MQVSSTLTQQFSFCWSAGTTADSASDINSHNAQSERITKGQLHSMQAHSSRRQSDHDHLESVWVNTSTGHWFPPTRLYELEIMNRNACAISLGYSRKQNNGSNASVADPEDSKKQSWWCRGGQRRRRSKITAARWAWPSFQMTQKKAARYEWPTLPAMTMPTFQFENNVLLPRKSSVTLYCMSYLNS